MLTYRFTPDAKHDLEDIRRYTNRHWGAEQSKAYLLAPIEL